MPTVTVTAPEGVQLNVRSQRREEKASVITEVGYDGAGNPATVQRFGPKAVTWPDSGIDSFASESRDYVIDAETRIVVEVQ